MQALCGAKNYDFIPCSFNYPQELQKLKVEMAKKKDH